MISLQHIDKAFGNHKVLKDFSMDINEHEFVSIMGPSGSGKTTILNLIGLLDTPDTGTVQIKEKSRISGKDLQYFRRYILGYVFQNYALIENETVMENLLLSKPYSKDFSKKTADKILQKVGLNTECKNQKVFELSGGEQQRIALARVMLKPCEIILADEPTGNLDEDNKKKIIELFLQMKEMGKTIVCVTHDMEMAKSADRILHL